MAAINNTVTSTNPFLNGTQGLLKPPSTSGTTTPIIGSASYGAGTLGQDQNIPAGKLTSTNINIAGTGGVSTGVAPKGLVSTPTNGTNTSGTNTYGLNPSSSNWYQLQPGESTSNYYSRTQGQTQESALGSSNTGKAPAGQMYDGQGNLVPITSSTQGQTDPYTNSGAPAYSQTVGALASTAAQPSAAFTEAQKTAQTALQQLQESRTNEANALSLNAQNPIPLEFQQGRGQILQNQYLGQQNALASEYQGAVGLEGAATGQQQTQQSGLAGAAGLSAPQQVSPTNVPYNPTTGQYGQPASTAYGQNGLQGVGAISGQIGVGQNVTQLNSVLGGANVVGQNLQNLISTNNINPSDVTFLNSMNQYLQTGVLSNPKYQEFAGQVNELINSLAPILGAGGSATDMKTQMASQILNAQASGKSMNDVIGYFLNQAKQKIQGLSQGGGVTTQTNGTTGSGQFSW